MPSVSLSILMLLAVGVPGAPTAPAPARTIRVTLTAMGDAPADLQGMLTLRAVMGPLPPITVPVTSVATPVTFSVPPRTMWETALALKGFWAAPSVVSVQEENVDLALTMIPTGTIVGRLTPPSGEALPTALAVKIDVPPGATTLPGPPSSETPCTVAADATFTCDVPAAVLDLSLHATGFVPVYRWGMTVPKGARADIGTIALSKGSSISGFVTLARGKLETGKGTITVLPETMGTSATVARLSRPVAEGPIGPRGFFQLLDVPPGRYALLAHYPGFATATVSPIVVYASVEAKVKRPIELQPPTTLTLHVTPPLDPRGKEWLMEVRRASPVTGTYAGAPVFRGTVKGGAVVLKEQQGGRYSVAIGDAAGNPFAAEEFTTGGTVDETHSFTIDVVRVKGMLRRGETPLAATLWFGGRYGDKHVAVHAGEDGTFHAVLPHAGHWKVAVSTGSVETELETDVPKKDDPSDEAVVDLAVAGNRVAGVVVDAAGAPVKRAMVEFASGDFSLHQESDANGQFHFDSVRPGAFTLVAAVESAAAMKSSAPYAATVGDSDTVDGITLQLEDGHAIHGRVLGADGPVLGADVTVRPGNGLESAPSSNATSGPDGLFDVNVAPGFRTALVVVRAPGYAVRVFEIAIDGRAVTLNLPQAGGTLYVGDVPRETIGIYFFQDGRYLAVTDLIQWAKSRGEAFSDGKTFHVSDVAPGRYRACALQPGGKGVGDLTRCAEGFLAPYGELHLRIQ